MCDKGRVPDVLGVQSGCGSLPQQRPVLRTGAGREHGVCPLQAKQLIREMRLKRLIELVAVTQNQVCQVRIHDHHKLQINCPVVDPTSLYLSKCMYAQWDMH